MKSKTAWAQTYYRRPWQKHNAAKTRSVKFINLFNFMFNIVSFASNAFSQAWHKVHDNPLEDSSRLSLDPRLNAALNVIHASIVIFAQRFFRFALEVRVLQQKVRAMADVEEKSSLAWLLPLPLLC